MLHIIIDVFLGISLQKNCFTLRIFIIVLEDLVYGNVEGLRDSKGQGQRGGVFAGLDGDDGLAGNADLVGQLLLGHLAAIESKPANLIA